MVPPAPPLPRQQPTGSGSQVPAPASPGPSHLPAGGGAVAQQCNAAGRPGELAGFLCPGGGEPRALPQRPRRQWQLEAGASGAGRPARTAQRCTQGCIDSLPAHGRGRGSRCGESHRCEKKNNWAVSRRASLAASLVLLLSSTVKAMNCEPWLDRHGQSWAGGPNTCPKAPHSQGQAHGNDGAPLSLWALIQGRGFSLSVMGTSITSACACGLLSLHCAPLKRVWLRLLCHPVTLGVSGTLCRGIAIVSGCKWLKDRAGSSSSSSLMPPRGTVPGSGACLARPSQKAASSGFGL